MRYAVRCAVDLALRCAARGKITKILRSAVLCGSALPRAAVRCRALRSLGCSGYFLFCHAVLSNVIHVEHRVSWRLLFGLAWYLGKPCCPISTCGVSGAITSAKRKLLDHQIHMYTNRSSLLSLYLSAFFSFLFFRDSFHYIQLSTSLL